jgi:DNA-binding beta-propeller fold protein YncE
MADCALASSRGDNQVLYIADTLNNRVAVVHDPLTRAGSVGSGDTLSANGFLNSPLGLAVAPNGNVLTVNSNDGFIAEIAPDGTQLAHQLLDNTGNPPGAGTLFGLLTVGNGKVYFVDDGSNTLNLLH